MQPQISFSRNQTLEIKPRTELPKSYQKNAKFKLNLSKTIINQNPNFESPCHALKHHARHELHELQITPLRQSKPANLYKQFKSLTLQNTKIWSFGNWIYELKQIEVDKTE